MDFKNMSFEEKLDFLFHFLEMLKYKRTPAKKVIVSLSTYQKILEERKKWEPYTYPKTICGVPIVITNKLSDGILFTIEGLYHNV